MSGWLARLFLTPFELDDSRMQNTNIVPHTLKKLSGGLHIKPHHEKTEGSQQPNKVNKTHN
jgi:hypothetical protein